MLQLYDLAGIYFRAFYAVPSSTVGPAGSPTGAIRGSLDILARVIADGRPRRGVACLDVDWRPAWRVALVPSYKAHRVAVTPPAAATAASAPAHHDPAGGAVGDTTVGDTTAGDTTVGESAVGDGLRASGDTLGAVLGSAVGAAAGALPEAVPDELVPQVPVLLDVLRAIGIPLAGAHGCEADDVIGTLAARETSDPVEVVSGDRDLFQVIRSAPTPVTVRYIGAGMSKTVVMDVASLHDRYGLDGPGYAAMATLRGDPSDGLPGVAGIGEKTATGLVSRFGSVPSLLAAAADPDSGLAPGPRRKIVTAADYLCAAVAVVAVRTDADIRREPARGDELPTEPADPHALRDLSRRHGIEKSVERLLAALRRP